MPPPTLNSEEPFYGVSSACRGSIGAIPPVGDGVGALGGASARPPMPPGPAWPPGQPVPRSFPRHFRHSPEMTPNPYI